eukprot:NODE_1035_length_1696_cov_15.690886_g972_i0.p1 GENE.NODE_1035_length_1696_cov_15.690886_g972_i0~~NODE_1035_length_1696_cov_15.690886_g972_i0.p1  ORF type:complete len:522 (-),score=136.77 NODE_1035_length_1696_cov_15.690886_g972_i0:129-1670(-)
MASPFALLMAFCVCCVCVGVSGVVAPALNHSRLVLLDTFATHYAPRWVVSRNPRYQGKWEWAVPTELVGVEDHGLLMAEPTQHYAIARAIDGGLFPNGRSLVLQYEVKFQSYMSCGGAYIKLLPSNTKLSSMSLETNFIIMFGPDLCEGTDKVHFIYRQHDQPSNRWLERRLTNPSRVINDKRTHLYTLIVHPDNSFQILVDLKRVRKGSLLTDFTPPLPEQTEIDDPTDIPPPNSEAFIADPHSHQPAEWEPEYIEDPAVTKPSDWVNRPKLIPNLQADPHTWADGSPPMVPNPDCETLPCGAWKAPLVQNPSHKKWTPPLIPNPNYQGWTPRRIPNPLLSPANFTPMGAVGMEVWSVPGNVLLDNFLFGYEVSAAREFALATWAVKYNQEHEKDPDKDRYQAYTEPSHAYTLVNDFAEDHTLAYMCLLFVLMVMPTCGCLCYCCGDVMMDLEDYPTDTIPDNTTTTTTNSKEGFTPTPRRLQTLPRSSNGKEKRTKPTRQRPGRGQDDAEE